MKGLLLGMLVAVAGCGPTQGPQGQTGLSGPTGPRGEKGEPGPGFDAVPTIAAVSPAQVVAGQTIDVAMTGSATEWTNGAIVNFGSGVTVTRLISPSPLALIATIAVDVAAAPGTRDLTITQNGKTMTWKGAFQVNPLYKTEVLGRPGRGALALVRIISNDPDFTFDTSWNGSAYVGVRAVSSPASTIVVNDVKPRRLDLLVTGDIDSPLGKRDLRVINQYGRSAERSFIFPQLYDFADLSEQSVTAGTPITNTITQPYQSAEFKYQPAGATGEVLASVTSTSGAGAMVGHPMMAVIASTGKFTSAVPLVNGHIFNSLVGPFYFVVFDPTGTAGFSYTFQLGALTRSSEVEPNDSKESAVALTVPTLQTTNFSSGSDVDYFKIVVTEAELGRHLRVRTRAGTTGQYSTDSKVEVFRPDGTLFGASADLSYHEDLRTDALTSTGDWSIRVSYGTYYPPWTTYKANYELVVNWE